MTTSTGPERDEGESSDISLTTRAKKGTVKPNTSQSPLNASHSMIRRSERAKDKRDADSSPSSNGGKRKHKKRKLN